jgi:hypothetical protein
LQGHLALLLNERLLKLLKNLFAILSLYGLHSSFSILLQINFHDPKPVVPTVEIPFVHLQHFVAKHQFHLHDLRLIKFEVTLEAEALFNDPLALEPQSVRFRTLHDALDQELELAFDLVQFLFWLSVKLGREEVYQDLSSVIPKGAKVRRQK